MTINFENSDEIWRENLDYILIKYKEEYYSIVVQIDRLCKENKKIGDQVSLVGLFLLKLKNMNHSIYTKEKEHIENLISVYNLFFLSSYLSGNFYTRVEKVKYALFGEYNDIIKKMNKITYITETYNEIINETIGLLYNLKQDNSDAYILAKSPIDELLQYRDR